MNGSARPSITRSTSCCRLALAAAVALLGLGLSPRASCAERATEAEMARVCTNWLTLMVHEQGGWAGSAGPQIREAEPLIAGGQVVGRCFSIAPSGHIVVPVLKELPPVKVYSEESDLDPAAADGPARLIREMLQHAHRLFVEKYGDLDAAQPSQGDLLLDPEHRRQWDRFLVEPERFAAEIGGRASGDREGVGPLLSTSWHQSAPYSNDCPQGDGGQCVVGCVATAAAQVLAYYQWPPRGIGEWSYTWDGDQSCGGNVGGGWLAADFRDDYDWANMPNHCNGGCTAAQQAAAAELCYEVGVAFEMDYGRCGSGAYTSNALEVLPAFFRFDPSIDEERRNSHSAASWFGVIREEIDLGRPMLYSFRFDPNAGHAIVCDGWRILSGQNQYHMNYGWGGAYNAWYAIDNIYHTQEPMDEVLIRRIMPGTHLVFQVRPDGYGYYPTIQEAVDDVLDGDIVELLDGVFTGPGNRDVNFHNRPITVRSQSGDPATCIIDCQGNPESHRGFVFSSGEGSASVLEGITIRNGYVGSGMRGGAILCSAGAAPTIRNCVIEGCEAVGGGGAIGCSGASPTIAAMVFAGNQTSGLGGAILACDGAQPVVSGSTLYGNGATGGGGGIWVCSSSAATLENCIVAGGVAGGAVGCAGGGAIATLECCDLFGNAGGDWTGCIAEQLGQSGNIALDPRFCDAEAGNFHLQPDSPCREEANPSCGLIGARQPGCGAYTVSPDGSGDFPTIQAAIDASLDGYSIELTDGVFTGPGNRGLDFQGKAIVLRSRSGDPTACVIDCQGGPSQPQRAFYLHSGEPPEAVIRGITIRNGYQQSYSGGAVFFTNGASPTIEDCIFEDNQTQASGGAFYCASQAAPTFVRCTFHHNSTTGNGGVLFAYGAAPVFVNCTFAHNSAAGQGGAISINASTVLVDNSILAYSLDGGAVSCFSGTITVTCSDIYGNAEGDWTGCIAGQAGQNGNMSEDPMFCNPAGSNYHLMPESPCAADSPFNPECGLLGAWPADCNIGSADALETEARLFMAPPSPNPSRAATAIRFSIPSASVRVGLTILDASGRRIRTLLDAPRAAGIHEIVWDGRNEGGLEVAGGIYFALVEVDGRRQARPIAVIR